MLKRKIALILWHMLGKFLPGHGKNSMPGKVRTTIAKACLLFADKGSVVGPFVDFGNGLNVSLGNNSGIGEGSVVKGGAQIQIGDNVVMGPRVMILSSTHHYKIVSSEWIEKRSSSPITIQNECFIGAGSIILANVTIGPRSVIAAGSVVTKNVQEGCLYGGVPARFIRKL